MSRGNDGASERDDNSFDALRLLAATAVLVGHAWPLTGNGADAPRVAGILLSHLGVFTFFSLSGFLIAASWERSPRAVGFLARRVGRIVPALAVVIVVTVGVVGPVVSTLPLAQYVAHPDTAAYLRGIVLAPTYDLPGVFEGNPQRAVNGSLWSLGPEFVCYLLVLGIGLVCRRLPDNLRRRATVIAFAAVAVAAATLRFASDDRGIRDATGAAVFFAVGAIIASVRRRGASAPPLPLWAVLPATAAWAAASAVSRDVSLVAAWVALPVIALTLAGRPWPVLRRAGRFGDFSYGLYLWAFPVQQLVVAAVPQLGLVANILLVFAVTAVLAVASWHGVEKHALRAVRRIRGGASWRDSRSPSG